MQIKQDSNFLTIADIEFDIQKEIIELLQTKYKFNYSIPEYPNWNNWSPKIRLTENANSIKNQTIYKRAGCYKIWYNDELIYIGETRCDNILSPNTRPGMWARRGDFRSTVLGKDIRNPYGNGSKFLEIFGRDAIKDTYHTFHHVHPLYCKEAELELLQNYYNEFGKLPILQSEHDYKRIK